MATYLSLLLLFACASTTSSNPSSCRGRCGEGYYKGSYCQCDYECLGLNECCTDFQNLCTTKDSCKGRCGEPFNRGNPCHCDIDCVPYSQCCPDYEGMCLMEDTALKSRNTDTAAQRTAKLCLNIKNKKSTESSNEEMTNEAGIGEELMIPEDESESTPSEGPDSDIEVKVGENSTSHSDYERTTPEPNSSTLASSLPPSTPSITSTADADASSMLLADENPLESTTQQPSEMTTSSTPQPQENASTAPTEGPTSAAPTEGPTSAAPTEGPTSAAPTEGPTSMLPTEGPTSAAPTEGPTSAAPTEGPTSTAPTEGPTSTAPTEGPTSAAPTEGQKSAAPTEGPTSAIPSNGPASAVPKEYSVTEMTMMALGEDPKKSSSLKDSRATSVPKSTSTPAPVKPTKRTIQPSTDKNDKSDSIKDYQADDYDTNLCSGRPVNGLTTLRNGTIVVFRGHYFWTLDKYRNPDPPQLITRVWGIPSPIDTVYTRCNCLGKTYFFKGKDYWRFDNGMMDHGFPKPVSQGFGQIGHITAALSIPEYRSRKESVIFFKRGGMAQKYTYQVTPNCGKKNPVYPARTRARRQAGAALGQIISISKSWRGFPTMVTSAVSVPSRVKEGYKYYVFSQRKHYSIKMEREKPVILKPATGPMENSASSFFKCQETQKN
ncbi:proteoglycan 4b isoform X7 [Siphateles boraxobius]|uniref:proteoglycan 4b isoform X7 n=1 Tax=Siphateles boraxobius TaxID=180520 RepID=UPI004062A337